MNLLDETLEESKRTSSRTEESSEKFLSSRDDAKLDREKDEVKAIMSMYTSKHDRDLPSVQEVRGAVDKIKELNRVCSLLGANIKNEQLDKLFPSNQDPGMEILKIADRNNIDISRFSDLYDSVRAEAVLERNPNRNISPSEREREIAKEILLNQYREIQKRERIISEKIINIASRNNVDLAGFEFRIKSWNSAREKVMDRKESADILSMKDAIRYTFLVSEDKFGDKVNDLLDSLRENGIDIVKLKNYWMDQSSTYNGVNVQCRFDDTNVEIQFHTQNSLDVKEELHPLYEELRSLSHKDIEKISEIKEEMNKIAVSQSRPIGYEKIQSIGWSPNP